MHYTSVNNTQVYLWCHVGLCNCGVMCECVIVVSCVSVMCDVSVECENPSASKPFARLLWRTHGPFDLYTCVT